MKGLIIIPCHNRPGFLEVCLSHIQRARGWREYKYLFAVDRNSHKCDAVISAFAKVARVAKVKQDRHDFTGNVYNVMNAYRIAYSHATEAGLTYVHLIEDDIFVAPDYFHFHEKAWQAVPDAFCVSACRNQNKVQYVATVTAPNEHCIYRHISYQSLGVSFRTENLARIVEHAKQEYWQDPIEYCKRTFPDITSIPAGNAEQAGLIHRIVKRHNLPTVYPITPRAYHAGFVGRNRAAKRKPHEYTAEEIQDMTSEQMNLEARTRADIEPCVMEFREVGKLVVI